MIATQLSNETTSILKSLPTTTPGKIATLLRSPLIKDEPDAEQKQDADKYFVASITDFPPNGYLTRLAKSVTVKNQISIAEKYQLQPNDVLVSIVGSIGRVAIIAPDFNMKAIPSSNLLVFRLREHNPQAAILIAMFYKSSIGQRILADLTHGKTIPLISKKAFTKTPFPALTEGNLQSAVSLFDLEVMVDQQCKKLHQDAVKARENFLVSTINSVTNGQN